MPARPIALTLAVVALAMGSAHGQAQKPFALPKDRAEWDARRAELRASLVEELSDKLDFPIGERKAKAAELMPRVRTSVPAWTYETFSLWSIPPTERATLGVLVTPKGASASNRVPLVVWMPDPGQSARDATGRGLGIARYLPAPTLAGLGIATLAVDAADDRAEQVRVAVIALDGALARPEVDPSRIAVVGYGPAGPTALALMAFDDRIKMGVAAVESRDFAIFGGNATLDHLAALCAPRPLSLQVGEPIPFKPTSAAKALERAVKGVYKVYGAEGTGLAMNIFGEFEGHDSITTRLQWLAGLEQLDKHSRPQGPSPLGHEPEAEPEVDARFLDLAEHGIAGWSASEMAQRPGTWTWSEGVISCKPGPGEFGWLRAPVEVEDFILRVEWRVPPKGNNGIFLRAKPVPWSLPTGDAGRPRLQALGLEWPSRTGLELQAQDDSGVADRYSSGSLYRHAAPAANPTLPPGQWNRYTVRARGDRVEAWSNGRQVLDTTLDRYPQTLPTPPLKGYIGLQNHGSPGEYRNVKLLRLGEGGTP